MSTERSDRLHEAHRQSSEKFDYFILGVIGAVCAYVSQTLHPARLGANPNTLELAALLTLFFAGVAGFLRIQAIVGLFGANYLLLRAYEERGALSASGSTALVNTSTGEVLSLPALQARLKELSDQLPLLEARVEVTEKSTLRWYRWRNWLLVGGFLEIVASKVWAGYL